MIEKLRTFLSEAAYGVYVLLFGFIFYRAMFNNTAFRYDNSVLIKMMAAILFFLIIATGFYARFSDKILKYRYFILIVVCAVIFYVQFSISKQMIPTVIADHANVHRGAILRVTQSNPEEFEYYRTYYHRYPNQVGLFMIQQLMFKIAASFGYTNFFMVACVMGHLLFSIMIVASFMYLDENISGHRAMFFLFIICIFPPVYFQSSISYTDTYSIWAIPCLLLFVNRAIKSDGLFRKLIYCGLSGILAGLAIQIKTTAVFVLIALFIQIVINNLKMKNITAFAVLLICFATMNYVFTQWVYTDTLDHSRDSEAMPVTHWIMMGLQGDGAYSYYDEFKITSSVPASQRVELNLQVINQRLEEMGLQGYKDLLYRKTCRTFGCGNAELNYTYSYSDEIEDISGIYEYTLEDGEYYEHINNFSQSVYLMCILLGVMGAIIIIVRKRGSLAYFAPNVALVGFWMFMMLWESNHRQLINQWSLFFTVAAIGIYQIWRIFFEKDTTKEIK